MKKFWGLFTVLGVVGFYMIVSLVAGCGTVADSGSSTDPGRITSSEVVVSGSATYDASSEIVDVNLNAILDATGEAITLGSSRFRVYVGDDLSALTSWSSVDFSLPTRDDRPMDMVFILDNTGSMAGRINAVKDNIVAFTATLEAAGTDARFGIVSFGDSTSESSSLDLPATAEAVSTWLTALSGVVGGDAEENPLTAIMTAFDDFSWRSGAQKVFIVITDNPCHQLGDGDGYTAYTAAAVELALSGQATVYSISPKLDANSDSGVLYGDVRWLADGYGWLAGVSAETYGVVKPYTGTGGRWIELPSSGNIDLTSLGIAASVTGGYTIRFSYTFTGGTWYIHILVDTDSDGTFDSEYLIDFAPVSASALTSSGAEEHTVIGVPPNQSN